MAKIIKSNGECEAVEPKVKEEGFELDQLQSIVGGYIEIIHLRKSKQIMVINEEGKLLGLPYNEEATRLYHEEHPGIDDAVVGNVLLCGDKEVQ